MPVQSFPAICTDQTHTLVLGSMPGTASLDAYQYYAHKRNAFWPIMMAIIEQTKPSFDTHENRSYNDRIDSLKKAGFGIWDVLSECERSGSLDSAIKTDSVVMNDFIALFKQHKRIKRVAFNGKASQKLFHSHVMPLLEAQEIQTSEIDWVSLPSSSPAMASLSLDQKHEQWNEIIGGDL